MICLQGQRGAVGVVPVRDAADRVAENLDRGFRDVFVVIGGTRLPQVLELPGFLAASFDIGLRPDASEVAQRLGAEVDSLTFVDANGRAM